MKKDFSNIIICMLSKKTSNINIYENINIHEGFQNDQVIAKLRQYTLLLFKGDTL